MASEEPEIRHLIRDARTGLAPASFPPRRDVEFAHAASTADRDTTAFHDVFWARPDRVTCVVARLGGGTRGSLGAHVLRALFRAAARTHPAARALDLSLRAFREAGLPARVDAAMACLDAQTGAATFGACGEGLALHLPASDRDAVLRPKVDAARLAVGDACWLSIGGSPPDGGGPDAGDRVRAAVAGRLTAVAAALTLRGLRAARGCRVTLSNDAAEIGQALAEIEEYVVGRGVGPEALAGLDVALDELLTNIVLYAYADGEPHEIAVEVDLDGPALTIEIRDDGGPFDPTVATPPPDLDAALDDRPIGGLGLHFVQTVFDRMAYRRTRGWNVLTLSKSLMAAPPRDGPGPETALGGEA